MLAETTVTAAEPTLLPALLPITDSQKGLLVVDGMVPAREIYNQIIQFDIDPTLPAEAVPPALAVLVTIQPALRQVFGPLPRLHARLTPPDPATLPLEQVVAAPSDYDEVLAALASRLGAVPFDLAAGPAYRFGFIRAADRSAAAILLCAHHIVGDGVSMGPVARDLDAVLTGKLTGGAVEAKRLEREAALLRELQAQNRVASSERTADRAKDWAERLREVPPLVLYPRPNRPTQTGFSGARLSWWVDEAETARFASTCKRLGVTPFVLLTAVYGAVLARHGQVASVLVGSPFVARRTIGAFDLCGFFVNTLPVTVDVDWTGSVDEHIGAVRDAVDFCRSNVDVPFNQLVARVQPDRSSDRNPLFAGMLAMQEGYDGAPGGAVLGIREPGNGTAKFDLWLGATPTGDRWLLELEYDRQLIPPAVADGLLDSLRTALRRALDDGTRSVADLFVDASAAASLRTDGWPAEAPAETLIDWFDQVARRTPDAVAVSHPTRQLTYAELADAANVVAAGLRLHGTRAGHVIGLLGEDLCDTVVAILAIQRCRATYLPLDATHPVDRLSYMVGKAGCDLVVGTGLELPGVRVIGLPELTAGGRLGPAASTEDDAEPATGRSAGYVMFTSGSTGKPKGVLMGNGPLLNLTAWQIAALGMDGSTRFLQYAPLGFDVSYQEILPTLLAGGTVVSREPADRRDFPALLRRIVETEVSHVYLPVAALRPLVQFALSRRVHLPALRYLCVSGEQLLIDDEIRRFFVAHPHCVLVNLYGPTETHAVTTYRLTGSDPTWPTHVPIGTPLSNVAAYVVDSTGHLAPTGVPGDLHLGGRCPADGYINDPERTAAGFLPDRFAGEPGAVMYRTGDRVVRDDHDTLIFLGRDDMQVKVRGYRIELGEIETVAHRVDGVRQAVAAARGTGADRQLVLFLLCEPAATVDIADVRRRLGQELPPYMVPAWIFDVERLPTSATGKTDRDALVALADRRIAEERVDAAAQPVEYADDLERRLAAIWSAVLGVEGVVRDRPVLEYGAHSLSILTALAQVQEDLGVTVPMVDFFRSPTVATLADLVRAGRVGAEVTG